MATPASTPTSTPAPAPLSLRDGTSQAARQLRALDPDQVLIDERSTRDLLAFAQAWARQLHFYPADGSAPQQDWRGLFDGVDLDEAVAYLHDPAALGAERAAVYARPHFALLLACVQLLGQARDQINGWGRRHLDYFYRDLLHMQPKPAVPDQVHVLVDLDGRSPWLRLPAGTALAAGKDSTGQPRVYRTLQDLVANRVQVAQVRSLRADIEVIGLRQACPATLDDSHRPAAFVELMKIALGQPEPGDPLPLDLRARPPVYPGLPPAAGLAGDATAPIGWAQLQAAAALIGRVEADLGMPSFDDFRALISLQAQRRDQEAADWTAINTVLVAAGRRRDPGFAIQPLHANRLDAQVAAALGRSVEQMFSQIEEIDTLEQAYAAYRSRRAEVADSLAGALAPLSLDEFESMMQVKTRIDLQWAGITRLLEDAGRRLNPSLDPAALRAASGFDAKLAAALPGFRFDGGISALHAAVQAVERYFHMPAEHYRYLLALASRPAGPAPDVWAWDTAYQLVGAAHREMVYARRRAALRRLAQAGLDAGDKPRALADVLAAVLGERSAVDAALLDLYPPPAGLPAAVQAVASSTASPASPADGAAWDLAVQALEVAQRNRQNFQDPVPERRLWRYLHAAADATAVTAGASLNAVPVGAAPAGGVAADGAAQARWKTFGQVPPAGFSGLPAAADAPPAVLGWALSSPLLALAEGRRTIELTLGFAPEAEHFDMARIRALFTPAGSQPQAETSPLQVLLSTAEGWWSVGAVTVSWAEPDMRGYPASADPAAALLRTLVLRITLDKGQPALAAPSRAVHGLAADAPMLRLMLRPRWDGSHFAAPYPTLRRLWLMRLQLRVQVAGLEALSLQNDHGRIDPKRPFEPFGAQPAVGSRLYLGHPELVGKALASLSFNLVWMAVPAEQLAAHYANYEVKVDGLPVLLDNSRFQVQVALRDDGALRYFAPAAGPVPAPGQPPLGASLFHASDATRPLAIAWRPPADQGRPGTAFAPGADVGAWKRCLVWELTPVDFQHAAYPALALQKSLKMAADLANRPASGGAALDAASYRVNAPYTPKLKSLSVDYSAQAERVLGPAGSGAAALRVFHVHPFGPAEVLDDSVLPGAAWLPAHDDEGQLCIGLRGVQAPQTLSLLLQVAEGSANPDLPPAAVQWSVLSGNQWRSLHDGSLRADASRGLINTGVLDLTLPPVEPSTLLPDELYWIRASMLRGCDGVCDMVALHPQAVLAQFDAGSAAPDPLAAPLFAPLPPGSIQATLAPLPGLARLRQPYTSFGGKPAEADAGFHLRVSERLRHKRRAVTAWDYERLVLERFPQVYKVKCLTALLAGAPQDPGHIVLVVIPDIRHRLPFNPFEPKLPADQIRDIEAYLQDKVPPFVSVEVRNAVYVPVKVRCGVRFLPGRDEGYCRQKLADDLNRFLSPWAYEDGADIVIGGSVYANSIINFIDRHEDVDYLAGFKLFIGADDRPVADTDDGGYRASAERPDAVLVAARRHQFDLIADADYRVEAFTGIDYMMIELDFGVV